MHHTRPWILALILLAIILVLIGWRSRHAWRPALPRLPKRIRRLHPSTPDDCPHCRLAATPRQRLPAPTIRPWREGRSRHAAPRRIPTEGAVQYPTHASTIVASGVNANGIIVCVSVTGCPAKKVTIASCTPGAVATSAVACEVPAQKQAAVAKLKAAARAAAVVIIATDPDREGEAIGWHIARLLRLRNPPRAEFHEITTRAIHAAIAAPRQLDKGLVSAQEARRILDRMVGYKASPALWRTVQRGLSAGRVQSVAMAMVADRERAIAAFATRAYWTVAIDLRAVGSQTFPAQLVLLDGLPLALEDDKPPVLGSEALAQAALDHAVAATWQVATTTKKLVGRKPWPPFTTRYCQVNWA